MQIEELYQLYLQNPSVQTDTRKLKRGSLFFALKGPNFNGNQYALQALQAGASYAIVDEPVAPDNTQVILVKNVLETLQLLAKYHREQFNIPFIAITGSNGKTTSKELVYAVLSSHFKAYTTEGNLNNHIGVPLTILSIKKDAAIAIIEMGANHQKEIEAYCSYTLPTHGLITNCGKAHLEGFGGEEGVKKGKGELYDFLRAHRGTAFVYADYNYLQAMSRGIAEIVLYGKTTGLVQGNSLLNEPFLEVQITKGLIAETAIQTQLVGDYNLPNILCAVAIGKYFGVPDEKIKRAIESYQPSNSRSQMIEKDSNHIILDAYNANPSSMKLAIENFAKIQAAKKVLILGGMMELGVESIIEHKNILSLIDAHSWQEVVLVGGDFGKIEQPYLYFNDSLEAREWFQQKQFRETYLLIKGSRSMQMERVLE